MTNREYYKEQILDIVCAGESIAVDKKTNKLVSCDNLTCDKCMFKDTEVCGDGINVWCNSEYIPSVDWSKVAVDTKILVSDDGKDWIKRYFAEYKCGKVYAFGDGTTSWSREGNTVSWNYAELAEALNNL